MTEPKQTPQTKGKAKAPERPTRDDARRKLAEMQAAQELKQLEKQLEEEEGHDWFVRCKRCQGVAFFLTRHPRGRAIQPDEWYSDYKGLDDRYVTTEISCQECSRPIAVEFPGAIRDGFLPNERYVQSIKDIEKKTEEAEKERTKQKAMNVARMSMLSVDASEVQ